MNFRNLLHKGLLVTVLTTSLGVGNVFADEMYEESSADLSSSTSSSSYAGSNSGAEQRPYLIPDALKSTVFADSVVYKGFYLKKEATPALNSGVSILVDFEGYGFETQALKDIATIDEAKKYIDDNYKTYTENGIEVRELKLFYGNNDRVFFWVGDLSFDTLSSAKAFAASIDKPALEIQIKKAEEEKAAKEAEAEANGQKLEKKIIKTIDTIKPPLTPEYMSYGDTAVHTQGKDFVSGWWEQKFSFTGYEIAGQTLDPFISLTPSLSTKEDPWSSKLEVGIGLQYRPWKDDERFVALYNSWISSLNFYASYLHREPLKGDYNGATHDERVGVGLYRDYNLINNSDIPQTWRSYFWGDIWSDMSYRSTNFGSDPANFDSWHASVSATMGVYLPKSIIEANVMPYLLLSASTIDRGDYWSNSVKGGFGIKITPFRNEKYKAFEWLYGLKIFAEYTDVLEYLKDEPAPGTDESDVRIGISYSHNRY